MNATPIINYLDLFETLQVFCTWSEDVHQTLSSDFFFQFFFSYQTE